MRQILWTLVGLLGLALVSPARAVLEIEISGGVEGGIPIAVVPFRWEGPAAAPPATAVAAVVAADLRRSGRFQVLPGERLAARPATVGEVDAAAWRSLGVDNLLVGRLRPDGDRIQVRFQLLDLYAGGSAGPPRQVLGYSLPAAPADLRRVAHSVADLVYEALTGRPGAFSSRIAYVTAVGHGDQARYALKVADSDGHDPVVVVESDQPLMSPSWSPDGGRLAYVSFEGGRPRIFVQDLATGSRRVLSARRGLNGAPAWSPDGRRLALTLSRDGDPEIYVLELASGALRRLTDNTAIDTEPAWSPDGREIVFTSDRSGRPQLYRMSADGGRARRITFEGRYNASADVSPDGTQIAMVQGGADGFRIAVMDRRSGLIQVLTPGPLDESPSFAPNGDMILYAARQGGRGVLAAVSVDGGAAQRLVLQEGDVREPAWGPLPPSPYRRK